MDKPNIATYLKYAKEVTDKFIRKKYNSYPQEIREEMSQDALTRAFKAYDRLEPGKPWKSFCYQNCVGEVKDYDRAGRGFGEAKWTLKDSTESVRFRVSKVSSDSEDVIDISDILASNGVFRAAEQTKSKINWELLSKLCSLDGHGGLKFLCFHILGFSHSDVSYWFGLTRERIGQKMFEFVAVLNDKKNHNNKDHSSRFIVQCIYALGLSEHYNMELVDNGVGHTAVAYDLFQFRDLARPQQVELFADMSV